MIQLLNINPFAEAMLYYLRKANGERADKRITEIIRQLPTQKEAIEKASEPAVLLEKLLDLKLNCSNELINKYFKKFDNDNHTIMNVSCDFCLAFIMLYNPLMNHLEYSADEICTYLRECSLEERMYAFCFGITSKYEAVYYNKSGVEEFSRLLDKLSLSIEDKWKIQSAAFNYNVHLKELLSLVMPAVDIINGAKDIYNPVVEDFKALYSGSDAESILISRFKHKPADVDMIKVAPMIFGFDRLFAIKCANDDVNENSSNNSSSSSVIRTFMGVAKHITSQSPKDEILVLSDGMKALSDNTRLEILFYLCSHKAYGQELCAKFGIVRSALSYHITKLMDAGFVTGELTGSKTYYKADKAGIRRTLDVILEKIK